MGTIAGDLTNSRGPGTDKQAELSRAAGHSEHVALHDALQPELHPPLAPQFGSI